jgi:rod shape-determining protein MreC
MIMANKQISVSRRILFAWFMLIGLVFLFAPDGWTSKFRFAFARIFCRPLSFGRGLSLSAYTPGLAADAVSRSRYIRLQNHLANTIELLNGERQKVQKLSALRDRPIWRGANFVLADVITTSRNNGHSRLVINRGKSDGLAEGQFVLGDHSIVGTISALDLRTAEVRVVTDAASRITVKIVEGSNLAMYPQSYLPSDVEGPPLIMEGNGSHRAKIQLLPTKHKIKVGDVVYAQKKPGFLDTPMIVGTVGQCGRDSENPLLWDITVEPACRIAGLKDVAVIVMNPQE